VSITGQRNPRCWWIKKALRSLILRRYRQSEACFKDCDDECLKQILQFVSGDGRTDRQAHGARYHLLRSLSSNNPNNLAEERISRPGLPRLVLFMCIAEFEFLLWTLQLTVQKQIKHDPIISMVTDFHAQLCFCFEKTEVSIVCIYAWFRRFSGSNWRLQREGEAASCGSLTLSDTL
jgi:hypothetical protein